MSWHYQKEWVRDPLAKWVKKSQQSLGGSGNSLPIRFLLSQLSRPIQPAGHEKLLVWKDRTLLDLANGMDLHVDARLLKRSETKSKAGDRLTQKLANQKLCKSLILYESPATRMLQLKDHVLKWLNEQGPKKDVAAAASLDDENLKTPDKPMRLPMTSVPAPAPLSRPPSPDFADLFDFFDLSDNPKPRPPKVDLRNVNIHRGSCRMPPKAFSHVKEQEPMTNSMPANALSTGTGKVLRERNVRKCLFPMNPKSDGEEGPLRVQRKMKKGKKMAKGGEKWKDPFEADLIHVSDSGKENENPYDLLFD